jgi:hypothetical protein
MKVAEHSRATKHSIDLIRTEITASKLTYRPRIIEEATGITEKFREDGYRARKTWLHLYLPKPTIQSPTSNNR